MASPIKPVRLEDDFDAALEHAAESLTAGDVIVLPTDTIYGVATLATSDEAVAKLFRLKERSDAKPVAVLLASPAQLDGVAAPLGSMGLELVDRHWPGPLTLVVERDVSFGVELGGDGNTIGVRCPDHDFVRALADRVGPLATTSANRSGAATAVTAEAAAASLLGFVGLVVDGGELSGLASTVVAVHGPSPEVLREGAIRAVDLFAS